jgi:hypothetical protein
MARGESLCKTDTLHLERVNDVRQTEVHMAGPLVPEPSAFEVEMAIEKLKRLKSPGIDQISAELINPLKMKRIYFIYKDLVRTAQ